MTDEIQEPTPTPAPTPEPAPEPAAVTVAPTFSPEPGLFTVPQVVTLAATGPEVVIHYTLDGSVPTISSPTYSSPFPVSTTTTVKAIAIAPDTAPSPVVEAVYAVSIVQPTPAPTAPATTADKIGAEVAAGVARAETVAGEGLDHTQLLVQTVSTEVTNAKAALAHLETSSNASATGTIVATAIAKFAGVIATLEAALGIHAAKTAPPPDEKK